MLFRLVIYAYYLINIGDIQMTTQQQMVDKLISIYGIQDPKVVDAMASIPREEFLPDDLKDQAYEDSPLPIGHGQTISQPFIVAFMTETAKLTPDAKVLEIGTGCGYQAAVLSKLCKEVYSIEVVEPLGKETKSRLKKLGYKNIYARIGDGYKGWPEKAPFDVIIVTAAPEKLPEALVDQLKDGGRLIIPVGTSEQELKIITKRHGKITEDNLFPVRFVPMVHKNK